MQLLVSYFQEDGYGYDRKAEVCSTSYYDK